MVVSEFIQRRTNDLFTKFEHNLMKIGQFSSSKFFPKNRDLTGRAGLHGLNKLLNSNQQISMIS